MFCGNCGAKNEDNAVFCGECGAKLEAAPAAEATANEGTAEAAATPVANAANVVENIVEKAESIPVVGQVMSKVDKKFRPLLLIAPIVIILAIIIALSSSGSYAKPLNTFLKLVNNQKADAQELTYSLMADFRVKLTKDMMKVALKSDDYKDSIEDTNDSLEDCFEDVNDEFKKWKIKFEKKDSKKLDKDDLEEIEEACEDYFDSSIDSTIDYYEDLLEDDDDLEDFADNMDLSEKDAKNYIKKSIAYYKSFKKVKITEGYTVKGKFIIDTNDDDFKSETVKLTFVKVNGDWLYAGCDSNISFEDSDGKFTFITRYLNRSYINR